MQELGLSGRIASYFINSKLTPLVIIASLLLGLFAVLVLPREEEPQIIVPMVDVFVTMPGASAKEVEQRVTNPMEKLLWEIPGIEYIYSTSSPGMSMAIVRFYVGQDLEKSLVKLYNKMYSNFDRIPPGASEPLIKPRSIDDVPILALTFWGKGYSPFELRRIATKVDDEIKDIKDVSETTIIGGQRKQVRVTLDPGRMAGYGVAPASIVAMLGQANRQLPAGSFASGNREFALETGNFLATAADVENVVVGASEMGRPIYLRDVAEVEEGPEEPANYVMFGAGPSAEEKGLPHLDGNHAAVTLSVAKRKGTNAIVIANKALEKVNGLKGRIIPSNVNVTVTRNYGETATEKSNELLLHMMTAIISVTLLIALALGRRESLVVAVAVPVTLALTLLIFKLYGYTLNRITLFALIFSIGILVDDAIVVVENIVRHFRMPQNHGRLLTQVAAEAVDEVGNPTILATFTVIAAILPMAFVGGLMGPYMRPIPVGASAAMIFSLLIAFIISPWAAFRLLSREATGSGHHGHAEAEGLTTRIYRRAMTPLIRRPRARFAFLGGVVVLLLAAASLLFLKVVTVKMLPFDNKSEFQVIIDMPEGTTLEQTATAANAIGNYIRTVHEVTDYQIYIGTASPYNFNGLVRHYFLRRGPNVADLQVNLVGKHHRKARSHDIAKRVRPHIQEIAAQYGDRVKVAEVPPGPPVLQTLVAEVYGPDYERQIQVAGQIMQVFESTEGVTDVDWYVEDDQPKYRFVLDKEKAALNGVSTEQATETLNLAVDGYSAELAHQPRESEDVNIMLRLPLTRRSSVEELKGIEVLSTGGQLVPLGELVKVEETTTDKSIYHKNLMPVVYVTGDVSGRQESPVYAILKMNKAIAELQLPEDYQVKTLTTRQPFLSDKIAMKWDGEWHITYEVFRDLGLAFAAVLILIYILVVAWFQSFITPLVIMAPIPLTLVGILPAHAAMGAFFTATSMIGFIAGAGIIVRNSIILVDFIELRLKQGTPLAEAVIDAGAVRFRPMLLTAAAVMVGASVILFDPIFQGLAISLMAGEVASTLLSRMAVPVLYYMVRSRATKKVEVQ
ncbi:MAG: efflux RND transporter permease subunit [Armatimonadetes bacterium]|nr:efflux RND transporter permease subunit [Armatimonadota bacterium]